MSFEWCAKSLWNSQKDKKHQAKYVVGILDNVDDNNIDKMLPDTKIVDFIMVQLC